MVKVLITGTSSGVGRAAAVKFLSEGYQVVGLDVKPTTIYDEYYKHYVCDVSKADQLPEIDNITYIVNNAGIVTPQKDAIDVNTFGYINVLEKYGYQDTIKSIVQVGSTASYKGYDNIRYCASQGARDALTKWAANNFGNDPRHVIVNSLNLDGIVPSEKGDGIGGTNMEPALYADKETMNKLKDLSILKRITTVEEISEWVYFLLVKNTCMTGQTIMIDGELLGAYQFLKYPGWDD